ncbi:MAG: sigma-70 family RNA polymerase sigma factor [Myxococcales bacterium]|nr:sigma-70 family RNA polymerase sigma factor [Myxococcales bacterium]
MIRELFEAHYDFVWRSARRLGVPAEAVDDAAQEVFLIASRKLPQILPGKERAFLFGVTARIASDARRAGSRRPEVREDDAPPSAIDHAEDPAPRPDEVAERQRARAQLDEVIGSLEPDLRSVFVLFELEGMTMSEIASVLELPQGTVASRLRRARELFQEKVRRILTRDGLAGVP